MNTRQITVTKTDHQTALPALSERDSSFHGTGTIQLQSDLIPRLMTVMHSIFAIYEHKADQPEVVGLINEGIKSSVELMCKEFPMLEQFEFKITPDRSVVGLNDVTNTILHAMNQIQNAPVGELADNPDLAATQQFLENTDAFGCIPGTASDEEDR